MEPLSEVEMLGMNFEGSGPLKILCLGAHCDDIEIGCGGTLLELTDSRVIDCEWVVLCANEVRAKEARGCADFFLKKARHKNVHINNFRDGFLPYEGFRVKEYFEQLKKEINPDLIFTHFRKDRHQDHALVSELTYNTFRNHMILEYEIPKYDGDLGRPNFYVKLCTNIVDEKIGAIYEHYDSQRNKHWFEPELLRSLMRIRGMEINSNSKYAESFYSFKIGTVLSHHGK